MTQHTYRRGELEAFYREAARDDELEAEALAWIEAHPDEALGQGETASGWTRRASDSPTSAAEATGQ